MFNIVTIKNGCIVSCKTSIGHTTIITVPFCGHRSIITFGSTTDQDWMKTMQCCCYKIYTTCKKSHKTHKTNQLGSRSSEGIIIHNVSTTNEQRLHSFQDNRPKPWTNCVHIFKYETKLTSSSTFFNFNFTFSPGSAESTSFSSDHTVMISACACDANHTSHGQLVTTT